MLEPLAEQTRDLYAATEERLLAKSATVVRLINLDRQ
jgi:hypothetical protein